MIQEFLCKVGIHKYRTIGCTSCFRTKIDIVKLPIKHMVWYQQCECCGKRRLKDTVKKDTYGLSNRHVGVEYARVAWAEYGEMYLGDGRKIKPVSTFPVKPSLKIFDGVKDD